MTIFSLGILDVVNITRSKTGFYSHLQNKRNGLRSEMGAYLFLLKQ